MSGIVLSGSYAEFDFGKRAEHFFKLGIIEY
jgi:hypothetical protein